MLWIKRCIALAQIQRLAPVTPSAISQQTGIPTTTLRDNVQRLVDRGLVRRAPNPADGRSYLIELTDELGVRFDDSLGGKHAFRSACERVAPQAHRKDSIGAMPPTRRKRFSAIFDSSSPSSIAIVSRIASRRSWILASMFPLKSSKMRVFRRRSALPSTLKTR